MSIEVLGVGETMAALAPADGADIENATSFVIHPAGAESNVACTLAGLGHHVGWVSILGDDALGTRIVNAVQATGVDVSLVRRHTSPTAVMIKDPREDGTTVSYYRRGSAASTMGPELVADLIAAAPLMVHLTGITPALSDSCAELIRLLLHERLLGAARISFDINFRPLLWSAAQAAPILLELARTADVVFVGVDEAAALWQCATAAQLRALLPTVPTVVVKDAHVGATAYRGDTSCFVPALRVHVVEAVGAGDAFAAGWLAGSLRGLGLKASLRLAHLTAAQALMSISDQGLPPTTEHIEEVLKMNDERWRTFGVPTPTSASSTSATPRSAGAVSAAVAS